MKSIIGIIVIGLVMMFSCKPASETRIAKLEDAESITESGIIYALPRTNLKFTLTIKRTDIYPGPYHEYAEKYLGIEDSPDKETSIWQIADIVINNYTDVDPEQYYVLEPSGRMNFSFNKLFENGSILPVNNPIKNHYENEFYGLNEAENGIVFKDLSVSKFVGEEKITYYKRVQRDSLFAKVPVTKTQSVYKSFEDKAEEAANFIFTIREKRVELLTGMADFYPEGESLEIALKEMERLENEYLTLFVGKQFESSYEVNFEFVPSNAELNQPYILFRFSEERGVLQANNLRGRPIIVELEKSGNTKNLNFLVADKINREGLDYKNRLFYRIPELSFVEIFDGNKLLAKRKVNIEQYGTTISIPAQFLMNDETFIEFYREKE
jgi:Domain of unknown function (DUF4831)